MRCQCGARDQEGDYCDVCNSKLHIKEESKELKE